MLKLEFDPQNKMRAMTADIEKQLRYATELTLNRTAVARQKLLRNHITSKLTIRKGENLFREVVLFQNADRADRTKDRFTATLRIIGSPSAKAERDKYRRIGAVVLRQDTGGPQTSSAVYRTTGNKLRSEGFVLPAQGLRGPRKAMPLGLYPHNIGVSLYRKPDGGTFFAKSNKGGRYKRGAKKGQFKKGTRFYFVKPGVGIFAREPLLGDVTGQRGRGFSRGSADQRSQYDAVWFFKRRINLPRRLRLDATFFEGLERDVQQRFQREFANALRTTR